MRRIAICLTFLVATACGGAVEASDPSLPPTEDPVAGLDVPAGPVLLQPERLIMPAEEFPLADFTVALDKPLVPRAWERQFLSKTSPDFHWFTLRLYVLEPDVTATAFIKDNGCDTVKWPDELPEVRELDPSPTGDGSRACRYEFLDGQRVLYHTTGYRNVAIVIGVQPRRERMTDRLALDWLAAMARHQIAVVGRVLMAYPPPQIGTFGSPDP
jgi:hypothetical protein